MQLWGALKNSTFDFFFFILESGNNNSDDGGDDDDDDMWADQIVCANTELQTG